MLLTIQTLQPKVPPLHRLSLFTAPPKGLPARSPAPPPASGPARIELAIFVLRTCRQPCDCRPHSRDGIRNEPAKRRDLSGSVGAMTASAAGSGKLKS